MKKALQFLLGVLLFLVAYCLFLPLLIINFLVVIIKGHHFGDYFLNSALNLDIYGNREFRTLWNTAMKIKGGYNFGKEGETISSALGKNKINNKLSWLGKALAFILDTIDKNHCIKSIR